MLFNYRHSTFWPYFYKAYRRMKSFESLVDDALAADTLDDRMRLALGAANDAIYSPTGYYASPKLESIFLEAAKTLPEVVCKPLKNTILHVMTQAGRSGGHTRVVQRWIEMSNQEENCSVVILNQEMRIVPQWLIDATINHGGQCLLYSEKDLMKRALLLRQEAAKYERIVLHVHMYDPTPIIAFGVSSFTTPIIFFNHADHMFWFGVSIADIVAELRYDHISYTKRDIHTSYVLGIPPADSKKNVEVIDKKALREELGIPIDDFVIITTGSEFKYKKIGNNSLCKQLVEIVNRGANVSCYAIGPNKESKDWDWAYKMSQGRILPLGIVSDKNIYSKYLLAADLYIGSYPYGGYTSMMDAVQCGLPFLQLLISRQQKSILLIDQSIDQSLCLCKSTNELIEKSLKVKNDGSFSDELFQTSKRWADLITNEEAWKSRLYNMYDKCPKKHQIHQFEIIKGKQVIIDDDVALLGIMYDKTFKYANRIARSFAHVWMRLMGL